MISIIIHVSIFTPEIFIYQTKVPFIHWSQYR